MERVEAEEEEEETSFMELLDSELLHFGAHGSSLSTLTTCSSSSSTKTTFTCSEASTAEEVTTDHIRRSNKKQKRAAGASASLGTIKVRKDKLGDKIAALQQLVSPFGKSDTASVLHEALGYIRFLHDQVQVLSSPYLLQRQPTSAAASLQECDSKEWREANDLRSMGLCLVPIACTEEVASDKQNWADLWSPSTNLYSDH